MAIEPVEELDEAARDALNFGVGLGVEALKVARTGAVVARKASAAQTPRAVQQASKQIVTAMAAFLKRRAKADLSTVMEAVRSAQPGSVTAEVVRALEAEEREREEEFQRRVLKRWRDAVPVILGTPDPAIRAEKMRAFRAREKKILEARHQAMMERADGAANRTLLKALSPQGAYWKLNEFVNEHTLDCLVLGEKFWPWSVLDKWNPPLHHGCPCTLYSLQEAIDRGLMSLDDIPDPEVARKKAKAGMRRAERLMESLLGEHASRLEEAGCDHPALPREVMVAYRRTYGLRPEVEEALRLVRKLPTGRALAEARGDFAKLHPRDRRGRWIEVLGQKLADADYGDWQDKMTLAVTHGAIEPTEATRRGWSKPTQKDYEPLPEQLFHLTTAKTKVAKSGSLKTRADLAGGDTVKAGMSGGGLGGGTSDTISFTDSKENAQALRKRFLEARDAVRGDFSIEDMIEQAKEGGWWQQMLDLNGALDDKRAGRGSEDVIAKFAESDGRPDRVSSPELAGIFKGPPTAEQLAEKGLLPEPSAEHDEDGKKVYWEAQRPAPPKRKLEKRMWVYKQFARARMMQTGERDALFWDTDVEMLRDLDPNELAVIEVKPQAGALGYRIPQEAEWRVHDGEVVPIVAIDGEPLEESQDFTDRLHPRNRLGEFVDTPDLPKHPSPAKVFDASVVENPAARQAIDEAAAALAKVVAVPPVKISLLDEGDAATARLKVHTKTIAVHTDSSPMTMKTSVVHEFGHYLDNFLAPKTAEDRADTDFYASEQDQAFSKLLGETSPVQALLNDEVTLMKGDTFGRATMRQGREVFARAFEQYVATRGGDADLEAEWRRTRDDDLLGFQYWSDEEFRPLARAMDDFLRTRNLKPINTGIKTPGFKHKDTPDTFWDRMEMLGHTRPNLTEARAEPEIFDPRLHPRNRLGKFIEVLNALPPAKRLGGVQGSVNVIGPKELTVERTRGGFNVIDLSTFSTRSYKTAEEAADDVIAEVRRVTARTEALAELEVAKTARATKKEDEAYAERERLESEKRMAKLALRLKRLEKYPEDEEGNVIFHRKESDPEVIAAIIESGELHGRVTRNNRPGVVPRAQAYRGPAGDPSKGQTLIEFTTPIPDGMSAWDSEGSWSLFDNDVVPEGMRSFAKLNEKTGKMEDWVSIPIKIRRVVKHTS